MNWVDLVLLGLALFAVHLGFQRGFLRQVAAIGGLALGIIAAGKYHLQVAQTEYGAYVVKEYGPQAAQTTSYIGVFLITLIGVQLVAWGIRRCVEGHALGVLDSILGAVLGVGKIYGICGALLLLTARFVPSHGVGQWLNTSYLIPKISVSFKSVMDRVPLDLREQIVAILSRDASEAPRHEVARAGKPLGYHAPVSRDPPAPVRG